LGERVAPEFLRSQIEIGTAVADGIGEARSEVRQLRSVVAESADREGLAIIAASTHPFGHWREQLPTPKERYEALAKDMGAVLAHLLIGGMHVHVGIDDPDLRVDLMSQVSYFIPHLVALSTSSPYWDGVDTGLQSYRKSVFKAMPRTGIPPRFLTWSEYERHTAALVTPGVIEDATKIWWEIRPSARYPTLEFRACDVCPDMEDSLTIAALYVSLLRMLWRRRVENQRWRLYEPFLIEENVWRAQRYPLAELTLIDFGWNELRPYRDLMTELVELVLPDAEALGCADEVARVAEIIERGTSADAQRSAYDAAVDDGADHHGAQIAVVDGLIERTYAHLE
jgi:carboxylate-amine ligase